MLKRSRHITAEHHRSSRAATDLSYLDGLGTYAMRYVKAGQALGLGTGHAASVFIRALGESKVKVSGVPTSDKSAELARAFGIRIISLRDAHTLAFDFDGADEVDPQLNMIKGRGGAMVREKVVAAASRRAIFLVGEEKLVERLGEHGNLPVEVVPFAEAFSSRRIRELGLKPAVRIDDDGMEFVTDNRNLVLDCEVGPIHDPARLERELRSIPGVVGTGLFVSMADTVLVASRDATIKVLRRPR